MERRLKTCVIRPDSRFPHYPETMCNCFGGVTQGELTVLTATHVSEDLVWILSRVAIAMETVQVSFCIVFHLTRHILKIPGKTTVTMDCENMTFAKTGKISPARILAMRFSVQLCSFRKYCKNFVIVG